MALQYWYIVNAMPFIIIFEMLHKMITTQQCKSIHPSLTSNIFSRFLDTVPKRK